jgi:hypothetical protein
MIEQGEVDVLMSEDQVPCLMSPSPMPEIHIIADRDLLELASLIQNVIERRKQEEVPYAA